MSAQVSVHEQLSVIKFEFISPNVCVCVCVCVCVQ